MTPEMIRQLRKCLGDTQMQFGARFQVSQITVAYWESGRSAPSKNRLSEINMLAATSDEPQKIMSPFRPIQYLGSKQRLAATISEVVQTLTTKGRVGDLFAGSGVVSHEIGAFRPVTAVDMQKYSEVLTRALLVSQPEHLAPAKNATFWGQVEELTRRISTLARPVLNTELEALSLAREGDAMKLVEIIEFGSLAVHDQRPLKGSPSQLARSLSTVNNTFRKSEFSPSDLSATLYFGGPYFSYAQAIAIDAISIALRSLQADARIAMSGVLLSGISEIVNTVGKQFAQPIKLQKSDGHIQPLLLERSLRDRSRDVCDTFRSWATKWEERLPCGGNKHRVVCGDVMNFVERDRTCSVYYADPPYTIDHYSRFYHVLETLVIRDSPQLAEMKKGGEQSVMRGIYRTNRYQSPFCIPSAAPGAFDRLFVGAASRSVPIILSYSPFDEDKGHRPRSLTLADILQLARRHYRSVEVMEITDHSHRKLNAKAMNMSIRQDAERLLICHV